MNDLILLVMLVCPVAMVGMMFWMFWSMRTREDERAEVGDPPATRREWRKR